MTHTFIRLFREAAMTEGSGGEQAVIEHQENLRNYFEEEARLQLEIIRHGENPSDAMYKALKKAYQFGEKYIIHLHRDTWKEFLEQQGDKASLERTQQLQSELERRDKDGETFMLELIRLRQQMENYFSLEQIEQANEDGWITAPLWNRFLTNLKQSKEL